MRIAYVSFELPPDTALGGIATYVYQVSKMMRERGHEVSVFCASPSRSISEILDGIAVHRIQVESRENFPAAVLLLFKQYHQQKAFDILESPEYSGDGYEIKKAFPSLPLVVKLHTPTSFIKELDTFYKSRMLSPYTKFRYLFGGWIRGEMREIYWNYKTWKSREEDIDYLVTSMADQIHTPSVSLGDIVAEKWKIKRDRILNVPYPFIPDEKYLSIPPGGREGKIVTYIGRLETRKGIVELVKAIPTVLEAIPDAQVQFIGKDMHSVVRGKTMKEYILEALAPYKENIHFLQVLPFQIPEVLQQTDVCVFPSIWENFPNVCLEAMSAGRAIVASSKGGMKDMLEDANAGILIDPMNPTEIAQAIIRLLKDKPLRIGLGKAARQKVLTAYNNTVIGDLMEKHYSEAIGQKI